ncbi:MAG: UDP-N-acetylmuramoyl-L-alanyl-D-glutamate--2,6-diaminopimelate ligase [Clostridia bacterium]
MQLSELFGMLKINSVGFADCEISGVTCSTEDVMSGSVFFALKGGRADGHDYAALALEKGAAAVIGERELSLAGKYARVENSRKAFALACASFWGNPEKKLRLCGVTGTNGKTTVTNMIRSAAVSAGLGCGLIGTVENIAGGRHIGAERTTPGPEGLYPLLREMADRGDKICSMEVSSHALAENRVYGMEFDVGVVTNLTRDHLDFHKTMEAYAAAKAELMKNSRISVINADDPYAPLFMDSAGEYVTYGIDKEADFRAENIVCSPDGVGFDCPIGRIELPPGGRFSVYNALAAALAAVRLGIPEKSVLRGLNLFQGVAGRMEILKTKGKYSIYIDYAHTPDGLENVLKALREFAPKKIITVFGCGGDRDKTKRPIMGEIASRLSDFCVVTSDNPRTENPSDIISDILKGMKSFRFVAVEDRKEAIRFAVRMAEEGDIILLAGKGHETYQEIGTEKIHMDERELVRDIENEEFGSGE